MREKWKAKINKWKEKSNWRDQLYFSFIFFLTILVLISTIIVGGITHNWAYCYTILMATPIYLFGKGLSILATRHLTHGAPRSTKKWLMVKSVLIFMGVNIIYIIPFFIVWLTVIFNPDQAAARASVSICFNWWMLLGWLIFLIIFSSSYTLITNFSWKKQKEWWKNQKNH